MCSLFYFNKRNCCDDSCTLHLPIILDSWVLSTDIWWQAIMVTGAQCLNVLICHRQSVPGSIAARDGALFYDVEVRCNYGIPCPPYDTQKEITCVVCTKNWLLYSIYTVTQNLKTVDYAHKLWLRHILSVIVLMIVMYLDVPVHDSWSRNNQLTQYNTWSNIVLRIHGWTYSVKHIIQPSARYFNFEDSWVNLKSNFTKYIISYHWQLQD